MDEIIINKFAFRRLAEGEWVVADVKYGDAGVKVFQKKWKKVEDPQRILDLEYGYHYGRELLRRQINTIERP